VLELLQLAVQQCCRASLDLACGLPLVRDLLDSAAAVGLMQLTVEQVKPDVQHAGLIMEALCSLTGMQQLQPQAVVNVLLCVRCNMTTPQQCKP
jgi:hypothetical protein